MKLKIIAVGNKSPSWVQQGFDEFARRMPPEMALSLSEIVPGKHHKDAAKFKAEEGSRMLKQIRESDWVVSLDESGRQVTSKELANKITQWREKGGDVALMIGGSDGLHDSIRQRANESIALSHLTLPHYLVRVVLAESLYRAYTITQNHPYHRQ